MTVGTLMIVDDMSIINRTLALSIPPGCLLLILLLIILILKKKGSDWFASTSCYRFYSSICFNIAKKTWFYTFMFFTIIEYVLYSLACGLPYLINCSCSMDVTHFGMFIICNNNECIDNINVLSVGAFNLFSIWYLRITLLVAIFFSILTFIFNIFIIRGKSSNSYKLFMLSSIMTLIHTFFGLFSLLFFLGYVSDLSLNFVNCNIQIGPAFYCLAVGVGLSLLHFIITSLPSIRSIMSFVSEEEADQYQKKIESKIESTIEVTEKENEENTIDNNTSSKFQDLYSKSYAHVLNKPAREVAPNQQVEVLVKGMNSNINVEEEEVNNNMVIPEINQMDYSNYNLQKPESREFRGDSTDPSIGDDYYRQSIA